MRRPFWLLIVAATLLPNPAAAAWDQFQIIEWQPRSPAQLETLKRLGISAGMALNNGPTGTFDPNGSAPRDLRAAGLSYYVENIATDFYSAYHRWQPAIPIGRRFRELQTRYAANPDDTSVFLRDPSLSDPVWLQRVQSRLFGVVHAAESDRPLFYNLGDETGIAELAAPWDFDLSAESIDGFRQWLHTQYSSLAALNQEWDTSFASWQDVTPELTRDAVASHADNLARWADFKAWMDVAFARAIRSGTDAVHRADPHALAAIEGAQVPGWGGYDYTLLSHAVDAMEIYDTYENLSIALSLNPNLTTLTTSFSADPAGLATIWREFLRGTRGLILWDDHNRFVTPDGTPGPDAARCAPLFAKLRGQLGTAVLASTPVADPIDILYSPASFRIQWLLEQRPQGQSWVTRSLDEDDVGNAQRVSLASYAASLHHLGFTPRYIGPDQLRGTGPSNARVLILPHAIALSEAERDAVIAFARRGGTVITDVPPGQYDAHGKPSSPLQVGSTVSPDATAGLALVLANAGLNPPFPIESATAGTQPLLTTYRYSLGSDTILAIQQDSQGAGAQIAVHVALPRPVWVHDLQSGQSLGRTAQLSLTLDPITPAVFLLSSRELPDTPGERSPSTPQPTSPPPASGR